MYNLISISFITPRANLPILTCNRNNSFLTCVGWLQSDQHCFGLPAGEAPNPLWPPENSAHATHSPRTHFCDVLPLCTD